ncbi:MarR family winged helix-turn-helix transcriptional regulator [Mycobacterium nebraskense]|uniref:MarR family winged helix-turn-helix transcriptional regulator n=1 Tax=Mycobacterium nebraskense TaxID=244292 RepID=UPI00069931B5|nr:MarR family transcriptional regulator [Mycobacterium nebraskense]
MNSFTTELISIFRTFGIAERETICCGTVTVPQCVVLQELLEAPNDISGLAERVGASSSAMTRLADGLERQGWVRRVRVPEDRRKVIVELTDEGRAEATRLRGLTEKLVDLILTRIPQDKHAQVAETVRLVSQAMTEVRHDMANLCSGGCG